MKRPTVLATLFYVMGIVAGSFFIDAAGAKLLMLLLAVLFAASFAYYVTKRYEWFIVLPFLVIGILSAERTEIFPDFEGETITVKGVVSDIYVSEYGTNYVTVNASQIIAANDSFKYTKKISVISKKPVEIEYGQAVTASGTAERLGFARNPGGFSEELFMGARGFGGKLADSEIIAGEMKRPDIFIMRKTASSISDSFHKALPEDMAAIMDSMVLGEKSRASDSVYDNFRRAGISHILSISGLNLSFIAFFVLLCLKRVCGLRGGAFATIIALWVYCLFTGAPVSAMRSSLMASVMLFGYIFYRSSDLYSSLGLAALAILMKSPLFLWDAGFLLSISAVLGIGFLTPTIEHYIRFLDFGGIRFSTYTAVSVAATVATLPVCAFFFYSVSVAGLIVNILIAPFAAVLLGAGLLLAIFGRFFMSPIFASVIYTVLRYFFTVTELFACIPFSYVTVGRPKLYNIALYYIIVVAVAYWAKLRGMEDESAETPKMLKRAKIVIVCVAVVFAVLNVQSFLPKKGLEVAFLDVGQGDATILHLDQNTDIMIDGGGWATMELGKNTGARTVDPYLRYKGISKLDAVFLTHPDMDHSAGVIEMMELIRVNRLFVPDVNLNDEVMELVLETAKRNGVPVTRIRSGYTATLGNMRIECFYPQYTGTPKDINNASLTLKITHGESTMLITGDIESGDEKSILLAGGDINSEILKVPHHGSKTSSTDAFVKAVSPRAGLVGAGKSNVYGHPYPEVVKTYADNNVELYVTAEEGAIILKSAGEGFAIDTMKRREAELWSN